jgi:PTH1 family peptidyl-tRNA hydrolase
MKLIVGLGNPGHKYEKTRHNVGYAVLDEIERRSGMSVAQRRSAFHGLRADANIGGDGSSGGEKALLLWPHTYMNRSGLSVAEACHFYKLDHEDLLVVCDDFNLPLGKLRFRPEGSAGGQKGLADIIRSLGTEDVPRLRIGIGPVPERLAGTDFVLGRFAKDEAVEASLSIARAGDAVADWVRRGIDECMNLYN